MLGDPHDDTQGVTPFTGDSAEERAMRDAEARALAESGLGSGLLARQSVPVDAESVPVLKVCPQCGTEYETAARFCPSDGTALRPKGSDSLVGRVLAERYHILKRIGEGGMGRVYLGEHVKMNRQCAIKVMSPALVNDHQSAARFAREASSAARIIHPNVAAVFDYGESDGLVYLVMEYVDGEPLSDLLAREAPFALDRALDLARQIADGLGAAHELGIVHRDLKPDNILVTRTRVGREVAKVVDFGIAKAIQDGGGTDALTRTGLVIGTPEFMSPEQLLGDPIDARSDLYALGCILHLMLTATPPFEATTREQMIKRRLSEDPASVDTLDPGIPESVGRIVSKLLARAPGDRYASAAEVRDALAGTHIRRTDVPSHRASLLRPTPRSAPTVAFLHATQATTEVTVIPVPRVTRRLPLVLSFVGLVGLGGAYYAYDRSGAMDAERLAGHNRDSIAAAAVARTTMAAASADSARVARDTTPVAAPVVQPLVKVVDSAKLKARLARSKEQDSLRHAFTQELEAARAPIVRYAKAIESGSISSLRSAFPGLTAQEQEQWEKNFFERAERIDATVHWGDTKVGRDTTEADFSLVLKVLYKGTRQPISTNIPRHATLARNGSAWQIVALNSATP
jgi:serine/threonine protein kinase